MIVPAYIWGLCSSALTFFSLAPYIYKIIYGINRPHAFTWIIWATLAGIAFAVQYSSGAGPGAWATGLTFLLSVVIVALPFSKGERNITFFDWVVFIAAMAAIPVWAMTESAAMAAIWVTAIDGLGYIPTLRKVWSKPHEEMAFAHMAANIKHLFSLLAMETYSIATVFYPFMLLFFNGLLVWFIVWRRQVVALAERQA